MTSAKSIDLRLSVEGHVPYEVKGDSCSQSRTQKYNTERLFFQIKKKLEYSLNVQIETDNAGQMTSCKGHGFRKWRCIFRRVEREFSVTYSKEARETQFKLPSVNSQQQSCFRK